MTNYFEEILYKDNTNLAAGIVSVLTQKQRQNENFFNLLTLFGINKFNLSEFEEIESGLVLSERQKKDLKLLASLPVEKRIDIIARIYNIDFFSEGVLLGESVLDCETLIDILPPQSEVWNLKKDELWEKIKSSGLIGRIPKDNLLWESKKDEIWQNIEENPNLLSILPQNSSLWNEKSEKIWEYIQEYPILLNNLPVDNINWKNYEEIWSMIEKDNILVLKLLNNPRPDDIISSDEKAFWESKNDEIMQMIDNDHNLMIHIAPESNIWEKNSEIFWNIINESANFSLLPNNSGIWIEKRDIILERIKENPKILEEISTQSLFWKETEMEIWETVEDKKSLIRKLPNESRLWDDKFNEILTIIKNNNELLHSISAQSKLCKDYGDKLWENVENKNILVHKFPKESSVWEAKKNEIWKYIISEEKNKHLVYFIPEDSKLMLEHEDEIKEIINNIPRNIKRNLEWKKREKLRDFDYSNTKKVDEIVIDLLSKVKIFDEKRMDYRTDTKDIINLLDNSNLRREITRLDEVLSYEVGLKIIKYRIDKGENLSSLEFSDLQDIINQNKSAYKNTTLYDHLLKIVDEITSNDTDNIENMKMFLDNEIIKAKKLELITLKNVLKSTVNRLNNIGVIKSGYDKEYEDKKIGLEFTRLLDEDEIIRNIYSVSDEEDIIYNSIFYLNKLTKLNTASTYMYVLNGRASREDFTSKTVDTLNVLNKMRTEYYQRIQPEMSVKFFDCISNIISKGTPNNQLFDAIYNQLNADEKALLSQANLMAIHNEYNSDSEQNVFTHLDWKSNQKIKEYIEDRTSFEESATKIVSKIKKLGLEFKKELIQSENKKREEYNKRNEVKLELLNELDYFSFSDFTNFVNCINDNVKSDDAVTKKYVNKFNELTESIYQELLVSENISDEEKNKLKAKAKDIILYVCNSNTLEQKLYTLKNRLIERYIEIAPENVVAIDHSEIHNPEMSREIVQEKEGYIKIEPDNTYNYENVDCNFNAAFQQHKTMYLKEKINRIVKKIQEKDSSGNFRFNKVREQDFIENGLSTRMYETWKKNAYFKELIKNDKNIKKEMLVKICLSLENEEVKVGYAKELQKVCNNFANLITNMFWDEHRNEPMISALENINNKNNIYASLFDSQEKIDLSKIFKESATIGDGHKEKIVTMLLEFYKEKINHCQERREEYVDEEITDESKEESISQQYKQIVYMYNKHDPLCISAHVDAKKINGFDIVKVSPDKCTFKKERNKKRLITRHFLYNFSENEMRTIEQNYGDGEDVEFVYFWKKIMVDRENSRDSNNIAKSRRLTQNSIFRNIVDAERAVMESLEKEIDGR